MLDKTYAQGINQGLMNLLNAYQTSKKGAQEQAMNEQELAMRREGLLNQQARQEKQDALEAEKFNYLKQKDLSEQELKKQQLGLMDKKLGLMNKPAASQDPYKAKMQELMLQSKMSDVAQKQKEREIPGYNTAQTVAAPSEIRDFRATLQAQKELDALGNQLADLVEKHGSEIKGPNKDQMNQIYQKMISKQKDIDKLGALSGSDFDLVKGEIGKNPTDISFALGANPVGKALGVTQPSDLAKNYREYGKKMKTILDAKASALGISPEESMQTVQPSTKVPVKLDATKRAEMIKALQGK